MIKAEGTPLQLLATKPATKPIISSTGLRRKKNFRSFQLNFRVSFIGDQELGIWREGTTGTLRPLEAESFDRLSSQK